MRNCKFLPIDVDCCVGPNLSPHIGSLVGPTLDPYPIAPAPGCCLPRIRNTTDVMVRDGWLGAGFDTVHIDDGWTAPSRDASGRLVPDPVKFPRCES